MRISDWSSDVCSSDLPLAGGTVSLDGDAPARHRGDIGYLPQEPFLFSGTVRENITMGREQADIATMSALEIAALAKDVAGFGHGVDAELGERGIRISGGPRQSVALARAAPAGPRRLALAAPFAACDVATDHRVRNTLAYATGP